MNTMNFKFSHKFVRGRLVLKKAIKIFIAIAVRLQMMNKTIPTQGSVSI